MNDEKSQKIIEKLQKEWLSFIEISLIRIYNRIHGTTNYYPTVSEFKSLNLGYFYTDTTSIDIYKDDVLISTIYLDWDDLCFRQRIYDEIESFTKKDGTLQKKDE